MAYRIAPNLMTLSNCQSHYLGGLCKCDFEHSCATVDMILTKSKRRAVPLQ